jgi:hypothetical protein
MAAYRVPEFTIEQRAEAAVQMLVPLPDSTVVFWRSRRKCDTLGAILSTGVNV